ncbi:MAG: hypothetical protein B7Z47_01835 [Chthoniobacter sp. 12-60-6]|nr:MAG: hypothetical protein B7Z47_01835 [Chthoniobacter sp. 12-60-6]
MNDFEDIQRLIRLKRFEQPEEGFTENFLQQFHQRQRAELLKQSSVELLLERVTTWWNHLLPPKWSLATAAVAVCAVGVWMLSQPGEKPAATLTAAPVVPEKPFVSKLDLSELPLARMAEHDDATLADMLMRKHLEVRPSLEGKLPAGTDPSALPATGWETPTLKKAVPAIHDGLKSGLGK